MKKTRSTQTPATPRTAGGIQRRKPQLMALEQRFMFDGAAVSQVAEAAGLAVDALIRDPGATVHAQVEADRAPSDTRAAASVAAAAAPRSEIVFVDTTAPGWQTLVTSVRDG